MPIICRFPAGISIDWLHRKRSGCFIIFEEVRAYRMNRLLQTSTIVFCIYRVPRIAVRHK